MRELTMDEIEDVNGAIVPLLVRAGGGAVLGGGFAAAQSYHETGRVDWGAVGWGAAAGAAGGGFTRWLKKMNY